MALWAKIQSMNADCQSQILSTYNEDNKDYRFSIEVRNLFAEAIEGVVCGGNLNSVDNGLDPYKPLHREQIVSFFTTLIGLIEERLGNAQSGDQFPLKLKLSETLTNFTEKKQSDPLGLFEHIRNRIKIEMNLVAQQEAAINNTMAQEKDVILENIQYIRAQIGDCAELLKHMRSNEEHFALNCNKKQEYEAILNNPEQLKLGNLQHLEYEIRLRENLTILEGNLEKNIRTLQMLMQRFEQTIANNLNHVAVLQGQIVNEKLAVWKHEQQQMANGINKIHSISLDKLQTWCEELAELVWKNYGQLKEAERILQNGILQTGNASDLTFLQTRTEEVVKLLEQLLNHSLIVEEQPPQIIKMKTKFPKPVVVSLLVGKRLNIQMDRPQVSTCLISEEQARNLPVTDKIEVIGDITNGQLPLEGKDDAKRLTVTFRAMQLKTIKRTDRRGSVSSERVMEEKSCLYFCCSATVGPLKFKVSTISLPVVVISHGSQEALAVATISWDNAFGEIGRAPFKVRTNAPWAEVAQILNAKFMEATRREGNGSGQEAGRGLTEDNLACLAQKAFRHRRPQPESISWAELCKDNLPGRNFTFWAWFHAALKLIEKKETHLKDLWRDRLIMGFIEREAAENLISRCEPGTFLLRFADSITGAITIALLVKPGTVVSLSPYQMMDLQTHKLSMSIKELEKLRYLYKETGYIPKDDAFGKFYDKEPAQTQPNPYVGLIPTIPDSDSSNGSQTPVPMYDGSGSRDGHRHSTGSLPGLSPIPIEQPHSPFFVHSPSPSTFHEMSSVPSMGMETNYFDSQDGCSQSSSSYLFIPVSVPQPLSPVNGINEELVTPRPTTGNAQFHYPTASDTFEDLITVISRPDGLETMDTLTS